MDTFRSQLEVVREDAWEAIKRPYPVKNSPLQIRPIVVFLLAGWLIVLGILGMAPIPEVPINDKVLHFFGMGIATFALYFVIYVPDQARRIWYYRRAPLILTLFCGFFCGGIVSEFVQGWLPWKNFDWKDVIANLLGCSTFFAIAHLMHQKSRKRYEISRLYQPITVNDNFHNRARDRFVDLERSGRGSIDDYEVDEEDVWGDREARRTEPIAGQNYANVAREADHGFTLGDDEDEDNEPETDARNDNRN